MKIPNLIECCKYSNSGIFLFTCTCSFNSLTAICWAVTKQLFVKHCRRILSTKVSSFYSKHCFDQNKLEIVDISTTVLDMHQFQTLQGIAKAVLYMCHNKNDYWILWIYFTNANIYSEHKDLFDFFTSSQSASVVFIITGE